MISSCKNETNKVTVLDNFIELDKLLKADRDKTLIVNFWATTCPPCIKEMPHFNKLKEAYSNGDVEIILVSIDPLNKLESRVTPFVEKHNIKPKVYLLADQNYSAWTAKIDPSWYGALPATLILKGGKKKFKFGMYESYEDLVKDIDVQ
jgi:thiol-disulfide isomerase/thioredoxin